jgi:carboxyl-terminal processing protease
MLTTIRRITVLLLLALSVLTLAQTVDGKPEVKDKVLADISAILEKKAYVPGISFDRWPDLVKESQAELDNAKDDEDFVHAVNKILIKLGTSHLELISPRKDQSFENNAVVGVGITVHRNEDGSLLILRTVPDAPAQRGGIVPGDVIVEVDGRKVESPNNHIQGEEGTDVDLTIRHANGEYERYILTRRQYSTARPEELDWPKPDIARLTLHSFDFTYKPESVENLMKQAAGAKTLILDLRDNGGGAVINMLHLLGMLMPDSKPIGVYVDRKLYSRFETEDHGKPNDFVELARWSPRRVLPKANPRVSVFGGKILVLINHGSGSASEIAAAALRDGVNATVIGTKSAGAVVYSLVAPITEGFGFQYPVGTYITNKGQRLEGAGVTPDILVDESPVRLPSDPDVVLDRALALVEKGGGVNLVQCRVPSVPSFAFPVGGSRTVQPWVWSWTDARRDWNFR